MSSKRGPRRNQKKVASIFAVPKLMASTSVENHLNDVAPSDVADDTDVDGTNMNNDLVASCTNQNRNTNGITFTTTQINGKQARSLIDSGSDYNFISKQGAKRLKIFLLPANKQMCYRVALRFLS